MTEINDKIRDLIKEIEDDSEYLKNKSLMGNELSSDIKNILDDFKKLGFKIESFEEIHRGDVEEINESMALINKKIKRF